METSGKKVVELNIQDVLPNRFQPRIKFNEEAISELSKSIKEHGVIQPIVVRPIGDKYEIIAGERRYKASCMADLKTIPAIITDLNDKDSAEVALIENVQRENLTPIEEAISYKKILDMGYITQDALASKLGKTQSTVANKLRLLNLDDEVQEALLNEKISERHARSLLKLQDKEQQRQMLNKIVNERLTVRRADEEIEKLLNGGKMETQINEEVSEPQETQNETKEFKFINVPNIEEEPETLEEDFDDTEELDEVKPGKFFNILEEDEKPKTQEEQIFDFNKMFINPVEESPMNSNNALLEELSEIENSINNSNTIKPIESEKKEEKEPEVKKEEQPKFIQQPTVEDDELDFIEEFEDEEQENQIPETKEEKTIVIPETKINNFKDVLQLIRDCSEKIEDAGFIIDTEEYDLDDMYQIIFKINK
ncbi:MAG: ParB/RepB/Spo0J family partition protein [Bacilli bacterium]